MLLNIEKKEVDPDIVVLEMAGRIVLGRDSQQIEWTVSDLVQNNKKKVVFDLSAVNYLDSTGVGIIIMCSSKLKQSGGELRLAGPRGPVGEVLKLTQVNQIVPIHPTVAAATQDFPG